MKSNLLFSIILAFLLGAGISYTVLYFGNVLPLQKKLDEMSEEANDALIRDAGFDVFVAVSLRESNQEKTLKTLDDKILPSDILVFHKFMSESPNESLHCQYLLWRIKKYSADFSVEFPDNAKKILNQIPSERPNFPGKIGNE